MPYLSLVRSLTGEKVINILIVSLSPAGRKIYSLFPTNLRRARNTKEFHAIVVGKKFAPHYHMHAFCLINYYSGERSSLCGQSKRERVCNGIKKWDTETFA